MRLLVKLYFKYLKLTKKRTIKIPSWIKDIPSGTFNNLPELEEVFFNGEINVKCYTERAVDKHPKIW